MIIPSKPGVNGRTPHRVNNSPGTPLGDVDVQEGLLAEALRRYLPRSDTMDIAPQIPDEQSKEVTTASWDDLAKNIDGIKWLVPGWVPYGMLTGLIAEPKAGKSAFALWGLMRPVLTGCNWFNNTFGPEKGKVLFVDTERSAAVNIDRMRKWNVPMQNILLPFAGDDIHRIIDIDDDEHIKRILYVVCKYKVQLVVVDSFRGAHGGDENNSKISKGLQALGGICETTGTACVVIHHTKKMHVDEDMTINAGRGSNAFLAAVRCQIAIDRPDPESDWRRVQVLGENLGTSPEPIGFRVTDTGLEFGSTPARPKKAKNTGTDDAVKWLREHMDVGKWINAKDIEEAAEDAGFSITGTLQRARERLGITRDRRNARKDGNCWKWRRPAGEEITQPPSNS